MSKFTELISRIFGSNKEKTKVGEKSYEAEKCEKCEPKFNLKEVEQPKVEQKIKKPILIKKPIEVKVEQKKEDVKVEQTKTKIKKKRNKKQPPKL